MATQPLPPPTLVKLREASERRTLAPVVYFATLSLGRLKRRALASALGLEWGITTKTALKRAVRELERLGLLEVPRAAKPIAAPLPPPRPSKPAVPPAPKVLPARPWEAPAGPVTRPLPPDIERMQRMMQRRVA